MYVKLDKIGLKIFLLYKSDNKKILKKSLIEEIIIKT